MSATGRARGNIIDLTEKPEGSLVLTSLVKVRIGIAGNGRPLPCEGIGCLSERSSVEVNDDVEASVRGPTFAKRQYDTYTGESGLAYCRRL